MRTAQQDAPGRTRRVSGTITSAGAIQAGTGFNVTKAGLGAYTVRIPGVAVILNAVGSILGASAFIQVALSGGNTVTFTIQNFQATVNADAPFSFTAEGLAT